jgi:hypothetical protein
MYIALRTSRLLSDRSTMRIGTQNVESIDRFLLLHDATVLMAMYDFLAGLDVPRDADVDRQAHEVLAANTLNR